MAFPKYFTLRGSGDAVVGDRSDPDANPDIAGLNGGVTITPSAKGYPVIKAPTNQPNPTLFTLAPIEALLVDGQLKLSQTQDDVRLLAKCSVLDIGDVPLVYTVKPHHVTVNGQAQNLPTFAFVAPTMADGHDDETDGPVVVDWTTQEWLEGAVPVAGGFAIRHVPTSVERVGNTVVFKVNDVPMANPVDISDFAFTPPREVVSNFKLSNTAKLRASLAKAAKGTGYSTHVVIGDSLSSPFNGSGAFDFPNSWWRKLWRALVASGIPSAGTGRVAVTDYDPSGDVGSAVNPHDPRIVVAGGWTGTSAHLDSAGPGDTITFTSDVPGEIVDVLYLDHGDGGGGFTVSIDGGAAVPVSMNPTWERKTYTASGLANTTHTVTVTATAANAIIMGFQVRHASGLRFDNLGVKFGIAAYWWDTSPDDLGPGRLTQTYSGDADVIHIALGSNDFTTGGPGGIADGLASIASIRDKFPNADCILYIEPDVDSSPDYGTYVTAMRALSASLGCPLVDLSLRYGTYAQIAAAQLFGADDIHLNPVGQSDWGAVVLEALNSVGPRSLA